ncbi:MAG: RimK family alpha-L-glutamate ligase [Desulfopila sp.]
MNQPPRVITDRATLFSDFDNLCEGDIILGRIPLKQGEEHLLLDLSCRGITMVPSASSQLASKSKTFQASILKPWMVPHTLVIHDRHQLLEATTLYHRHDIGKVVLKQERKNAGLGILMYNSIEEIYSQAAHHNIIFPFVLQPFHQQSRDLRVIIIGSYMEAYSRHNPNNFRNNLHCGGQAETSTLSEEICRFCHTAMARADFPYAHLDLMYTADNRLYLAEINLRGGLRGAGIRGTDYKNRTAAQEKIKVDEIIRMRKRQNNA